MAARWWRFESSLGHHCFNPDSLHSRVCTRGRSSMILAHQEKYSPVVFSSAHFRLCDPVHATKSGASSSLTAALALPSKRPGPASVWSCAFHVHDVHAERSPQRAHSPSPYNTNPTFVRVRFVKCNEVRMLLTFFSDNLPDSPLRRRFALTLSVNATILRPLSSGEEWIAS